MFSQDNLFKARAKSILLCLLMVLSTTAALATTVSASQARTYTTNRDPHDVAIGDFNCDNHNDIAFATDGTHTITILWNDGNGDFSERQDIWVSSNQDRNANWDEFSNVQFIEVGEFTGDNAIDIVIYQRNNPFKTNDDGTPAGEPGNVTVIENGGCNEKTWSIGERFTHFWAWDLEVSDLNNDGNDDIMVLDLQEDITTQRVFTYLGPISSATNPVITGLGSAQLNSYRAFAAGDWGEEQGGLPTGGGGCFDNDMWLLRNEGVDYASGQPTNPGHNDNVSIVEFNCLTNSFPLQYQFSQSPGIGEHVINMNTPRSSDLAVSDIDNDGVADVLAMVDDYIENVTYVTSSSLGTWTSPSKASFGTYAAFTLNIADLNGDQEPDFIIPGLAEAEVSTDSTGVSTNNYLLTAPTSIQITLSDGNGGYLTPLSYAAGLRPHTAEVGQLVGGQNSPLDVVVAHKNHRFGGWSDNLGWEGQYDTITVIEMDNQDLSVSDIDISPVDRYIGIVGEGNNRDLNVTVTNTGMSVLNGLTANLDVELKIVDQLNSTNITVYANDWDNSEDSSGCGSGCNWDYIDYVDGNHHWNEQTTQSSGTGTTPDESQADYSANYLNPTHFMWSGETKTDSNGGEWTGYGANWDEAMVLTDVDLTGSDRAFMSVELYRHLGYEGLGFVSQNGNFIIQNLWDDLAMIEVGSEETGWDVISCPTSAFISGACWSGDSIWGGFDNERVWKQYLQGLEIEGLYDYDDYYTDTFYGWDNFTDDGIGTFDLSPWAGEKIDLRFRFRTGFGGSISDDNETRWSGFDGFAVDNLTITKQNTQFFPNPQLVQTQLSINNLGPGQNYEASLKADFLNDTTYRISATLSGNSWDQQPINDEIIDYVTPFNLYDPALENIEYFEPGRLYAQGAYPISATTNNWGNSMVDFDIIAKVSVADPSPINCGVPSSGCNVTFEAADDDDRYEESADTSGSMYNDSSCLTDLIFNSNAYWFGHPCDTSNFGYDDNWTEESLSIVDIDLENLEGDFVSLEFEYFAETFYQIDSDGDISPSDFMSLSVEYKNGSNSNLATIYGKWNDYNEDGTCQVDEDGNGIVNETNPIDFDEIELIGDSRNVDGVSGNWDVFFNSEGGIKSTNIDLTHLYVLNRSAPDEADWDTECLSLENHVITLNFDFYSDDDGRNGINDGLRGIGINNITIEEGTFTEEATYMTTRTSVDANDVSIDEIGEHQFDSGVYMITVETVFDNSTIGTNWYGSDERSTSNNIKRVVFEVKSVDINIKKPKILNCLDDQIMNCVLPISSSLNHNWEVPVVNGVLEEDYTFYMDVFDQTTNSLVYSTSLGPVSLVADQRTNLIFDPFADSSGTPGWIDGHTYNISYRAEISDGTPSGLPNYFIATFADQVDVAILSSELESEIIQELKDLDMTYTQFEVLDWDDYFQTNWFTNFDKIILPWQDDSSAKDDDGAYYLSLWQNVNNIDRKQVLESYMSSGGTIQAHLPAHGEQIYGLSTGLDPRLALDLEIDNKFDNDEIGGGDLEFVDPYHPIMDGIDLSNLLGSPTIANSVLDTSSESTNDVPKICDGMQNVASFQPLIRDVNQTTDVLLGVCSYGLGGMIISTIDVEKRAKDSTGNGATLLSNMLEYKVTDYPNPFGAMLDGTTILINDNEPLSTINSPGCLGYCTYYMKSEAELTFSYQSDAQVMLYSDWVIEGPTNWNGNTMASGTDHTDVESPTKTFCATSGANEQCIQEEEWIITLWLHDDEGHSRMLTITVQTNDAYADSSLPLAEAYVEIDPEFENNVKRIGTCSPQDNYPKYEIILGDEGQIPLQFNASNSTDPDATEGSGIEEYIWKVVFDKPWQQAISVEPNVYEQQKASNGIWQYTFGGTGFDENGESYAGKNLTFNPLTQQSIQPIRVTLQVIDKANKPSTPIEFCFDVKPQGFGDEPPVIQFTNWADQQGYVDSYFNLSGTVVSGSTEGDIWIKISTNESLLDEADVLIVEQARAAGNLAIVSSIGNGESFKLSLNIDRFHSNESTDVVIYITVYELADRPGAQKRWIIEQQLETTDSNYVQIYNPETITLTLPICRGVLTPDEVSLADPNGRWVFISGECQWEGKYSYVDGEWLAPSSDNDGDGASSSSSIMYIGLGAAILVIVVGLTIIFLRKSGSDGIDDDYKDFNLAGAFQQQDPVEQYVQQLIAQGYPEDTARAYASQYAAQAGLGGQQSASPAAAQASSATNPAMEAAYQQYYQQFISQGYDEQTATAYAQQYAAAYVQQQGL